MPPGISIPQLAARLAVKAGPAPDAGADADNKGGSPFADILNGQMDSPRPSSPARSLRWPTC